MSKNILVVCPKFPYPPNDGSKLANCSLLECLQNLDFKIDFICYTKEKISQTRINEFKRKYNISRIPIFKRAADRFKLVRLSNAFYSVLNSKSLPSTYIPFKLSNCEAKELRHFNSDWKYIIFDGLHSCVGLLEQKLLKLAPDCSTIYRAHNCESELWFQTGSRFNLLLKTLINNQAQRVKSFESDVIKQVNKLWTLSIKDQKSLSGLQQSKSAEVIPVAFDFKIEEKQSNQNEQINLLFIGGLNWAPNRQGLVWFMENVWENASRLNSNLRLHIVGKNSRKFLRYYLTCQRLKVRFLSYFYALEKIEIHDYVENLDNIYAASDCCIIPIFTGSGVRIKAIEAACHNLAIISTEIGVSGLDLQKNENYLNANNAEEWIDILKLITKPLCKQIGESAHTKLKSSMSKQVVIKKIADALG